MQLNNTTPRKYPRTMKEAFGPYTSDELYSDNTPSPCTWSTLLYAVLLVAACAATGVILAWRG